MSPPAVSSSSPKTCDDFPPVDLKPLRQLPDQARLNAKDLASKPLQEYYQKANAYMLMDMQDYGIGNGNGLLEVAEVNQFLAKYPSKNPQVNACAMLQEASAFAKMAPALTESFRKSGSITEEFSKIKKDAVEPKEEKSVSLWQILLGAVAVGWLIKKIIARFRGGPPKDGGGSGPKKPEPPQKKPASSPLNGKAPEAGTLQATPDATKTLSSIPLNGEDLTTQIHRLYGGVQIYAGAGAQPSLSAVNPEKGVVPVILPLVNPLPLTMPAFKTVPLVRPVPILAR